MYFIVMYLNGLSFIFCMIYTYICIDTTFKVLSMLLPLLQGTKGYCCVRATIIDKLVPNGYKVVTTLLPGGKRANSRVQTTLLYSLVITITMKFYQVVVVGLLQGCPKLVAT